MALNFFYMRIKANIMLFVIKCEYAFQLVMSVLDQTDTYYRSRLLPQLEYRPTTRRSLVETYCMPANVPERINNVNAGLRLDELSTSRLGRHQQLGSCFEFARRSN
jgi:hypothetical protein